MVGVEQKWKYSSAQLGPELGNILCRVWTCHQAGIASIDSYSNSCGVDCTDRRVYSLGLLGWVRP